MIKTRFAPSPTGYIHLGNLRTALFNWLLAQHEGGKFLLRIEDTDTVRSETIFADKLQEQLQWLGLDWQEGPGVAGKNGPYFQSMRTSIYAKYYDMLQQQDQAYLCFCSDDELATARATQIANKKAPRYSGKCGDLSEAEIAEKIASGQKPTLRFRVARNQKIKFHDFIRGEQCFNSNDIGDFIIRRANGSSSFMFCNVIDDSLMQVTHVLRGEDHLANTPRQIMILQALALDIPQYGHMPLIVGKDGKPLSKRHGSFNVEELRSEGYLPQALLNYLARLGHNYKSQAVLDNTTLANRFNRKTITKSASCFDKQQLDFWQKQVIANLSAQDIIALLQDKLHAVPKEHLRDFVALIKPNISFLHEIADWAKIFFIDELAYDAADIAYFKQVGAEFFQETDKIISAEGADVKVIAKLLKQNLGVSGKDIYLPLRLALTGEKHGPELAGILSLLGQDKIQQRLQAVIKLI